MITVVIDINGRTIYSRAARNITFDDEFNIGKKMFKICRENEKNGYNTYIIDTGELIRHKREDGGVKLAEELLETIKQI